MENSSFKRRLDDMYFQSSPFSSSKRKRANEGDFSRPSTRGPARRKSILEPFERQYRHIVSASRMRQGRPFAPTMNTFAARPYARERTTGFVAGSSFDYPRTPLRQLHYSPRSTWSGGTEAEVSAVLPEDALGLCSTPEFFSSSTITDSPLNRARSALGYGSFDVRGVVNSYSSSKNSVGVAKRGSRFTSGVAEAHLNGLSKKRLLLGSSGESIDLAKLKGEQGALEKKLSALRPETEMRNDLCWGGGEDREQADVTELDAVLGKDYKKLIPSLQRDDKRLSDGITSRSNLQQARFVATGNAYNECSSNGTLDGSGKYHVDGTRQREKITDDDGLTSTSERQHGRQVDKPVDWRALYQQAKSRDPRLNSLKLDTEFLEKQFAALSVIRPTFSKAVKKDEREAADAFTPLSEEAENQVDDALRGSDRNKVLIFHEKSNIDVTRAVMQCLLPGAWLNDEVINIYMELLKERELQDPKKFLKCHFFNTFFYNKLYKDKHSYDYKAVRRWTSQKKLGYSLSDCDKILVPIHQDVHWCLAVINIRDRKLEYLDSLQGRDNAVLKVLARYIADEVKDKDGKILDSNTWEHEFPTDIPEQLNGCDCGMFMLKYADFHSRGFTLTFKQGDMPYFRRRMVWELLQLKAT